MIGNQQLLLRKIHHTWNVKKNRFRYSELKKGLPGSKFNATTIQIIRSVLFTSFGDYPEPHKSASKFRWIKFHGGVLYCTRHMRVYLILIQINKSASSPAPVTPRWNHNLLHYPVSPRDRYLQLPPRGAALIKAEVTNNNVLCRG